MCVRIVRMNEADLGLFQFDYDLTWMSFLMSAGGRIYSRYGGRDASGAAARLSVDGLKHTMNLVLLEHKARKVALALPPHKPLLPEDAFPVKGKGCLHCHMVWEGLRKQARADGTFTLDSLYVYPPPDNVGLQLDVAAGDKVVAVAPDSPAQRAGLKAGDLLTSIGEVPILSQGDALWALHNAPVEGKLAVQFTRQGKPQEAKLVLEPGWKKSDLSWRKSMKKEKK